MSSTPEYKELWTQRADKPRDVLVSGTYFDWVQQTDHPDFEVIRSRIADLWRFVPLESRPGFLSRLKSKRYSDFFSAYSEMWYCHALCVSPLSCSFAASLPSGSVPDYQLFRDSKPVAYGECHLKLPPERQVRSEMMQRRWFWDTFRMMRDKRVRLWLHHTVCGAGTPNARLLARELDRLAEHAIVEEDRGTTLRRGRHQYRDVDSGWSLDFTLIQTLSQSNGAGAQLLWFEVSAFEHCQGATLLAKALAKKSRQHTGATLPIVICLGWAYFDHEPDRCDLIEVILNSAASLSSRGVYGVFWTGQLYPWGSSTRRPELLHWQAPELTPLLSAWTGPTTDVRKAFDNIV